MELLPSCESKCLAVYLIIAEDLRRIAVVSYLFASAPTRASREVYPHPYLY